MSIELENRFYLFAKSIRDFCLLLKRDVVNLKYIKQLIRSSGSIGANYIEAKENLGFADEKMKLKIARKEAKETVYWLHLILTYDDMKLDERRTDLINEANQVTRILSAIILKVQNRETN